MATKVYIEDLSKHVGENVTLQGWLYNLRSSGKIKFLLMRDGTGICQGVAVKSVIGEELFNRAGELTQESSFRMSGTVRAEQRAPGGFEMDVTNVEIISIATEYPITPKEHGVEFLADRRHLDFDGGRRNEPIKMPS